MRRIVPTLALALTILAPFAPASGTTLDYQGYGFETGGFPPSVPGDTLRIPIIVDAFSPELGIDFATEEVTGWIDGLVSSGPQDGGDGVQFFTFSAGRISIYRDPARDHDFGQSPPSLTVPGTFTNGELCLAGDLTDFILYLDTDTNTGAYQGNVVFDSGDCLGALHAIRAEGFTFGGVLTRQSIGGNTVPTGYDMSIDGFLEAQKVAPPEECDFACMGLQSARCDFPRRTPEHFGPKDGKFHVEGNFLPCATDSALDPGNTEVRVRLGDYVQVFPEGSLRRSDHHHSSDVEWSFDNDHGTETITEFEIQHDASGEWEFTIEGRGIARSALLNAENLLIVGLDFGTQSGTTQETLVQKKKWLRFESHHEPCERDDDVRVAPPQPGIIAQAPAGDVMIANPNPFNGATTIALHLPTAGDTSLRVYDIRGRLVRQLQSGPIAAGDHRFVWDGRDATGAAVASGVYFYRLDGAGLAVSKKLVIAK